MATSLPRILLQIIRSRSPFVLLSSAARHFWSGDNVDGGAALALCLLKVAALSWTRFWTSTVEAQIGGEQQPGDAEKAATAAGRVCTLAGGLHERLADLLSCSTPLFLWVHYRSPCASACRRPP